MTNKTPNRFDKALSSYRNWILTSRDYQESQDRLNTWLNVYLLPIIDGLEIASDLENNTCGGAVQEPFVIDWGNNASVNGKLEPYDEKPFDMEPVTAWRNRTCKPEGIEV